MPNTKSAEKQVRVSERRKLRNKARKSQCKTIITRTEKLISGKQLEPARESAVEAISCLDKAAEKGVLHPNNASRRKSRLVKKLNRALATAPPSGEKSA